MEQLKERQREVHKSLKDQAEGREVQVQQGQLLQANELLKLIGQAETEIGATDQQLAMLQKQREEVKEELRNLHL